MRRVAMAALLVAGAARAQYLPHKILHDPQPFRIDGRFTATPAGPLAGVVSDVQAAANLWSTAPGSYARWSYAGTSTAVPDPSNLTSEWPIWVTQATDPYYDLALGGGRFISGNIPLTYAGQLYACDIFLNAVNQAAWASGTLPLTPTTASVQTIVLHEMGHCLGLEDTSFFGDTNNAMYQVEGFQLGIKRTALGADDIQRISTRYPNNQSAVGSPCTVNCAPGLTCIQPATGSKMCSSPCAGPPGSCPIPYVCKQFTLIPGSMYACLPNSGTDITQVGRACAVNTDCGGPAGICTLETAQPSGKPLWDQGYCTQNCAAGQPACPSGSQCLSGLPGTPSSRCVKSCRVGFGDCRLNYACAALPGVTGGVCIPACGNDVDCSQGVCRSCDGLCFSPNRPIGQIGDPCTADNQCGPAQFCAKGFPWAPTQGVCTQGCSYSCAACPNGSNCIANPFLGGALMCMRDCAEGTCQVGQQCLPVAGSHGCAPGCGPTGSCPPAHTCEFGQCVPTNRDGGSCELCFAGTSGGGGGGGGLDGGGTGNPIEGGCGCGSSGATSAAIALAILFLATRRARRAWPPR